MHSGAVGGDRSGFNFAYTVRAFLDPHRIVAQDRRRDYGEDGYRRKVVRLAEALDNPEDCDVAASAIRGLIERIVLTPGEK